MKKIIKWGILAPGRIAHRFAKDMKETEGGIITAVASRSLDRAREFGNMYDIPNAYGSYEELVKDPNVDIVYVATPHPMHKEYSKMCMEAGKSVLCEKPITINASELEELMKCASVNKVFFMEAMWTRFLPSIVKLREIIENGDIGEVRMITANFGYRTGWDPYGRALNNELGGGALLDVGIYPISFVSMILGTNPTQIMGAAHIGETRVDEQFSAVLSYKGGEIASVQAAVRTNTPHDAWIMGTKGSIHMPEFYKAKELNLYFENGEQHKIEVPYKSSGFSYEIDEAMECLRNGKLESNIMSQIESLEIMKILDELRKRWNLKYPNEI